MNTSKQVNVIVGLLFVGALATLLYFVWDSVRADDATERQLLVNAERGGALFSLNCSSCHGLTGKGPNERKGLPGAILNDESNRSTSLGVVTVNTARFRDTIRCGRVGTLMPAWSQSQGGSLNDFQINQLVALITGVMTPQDGSITKEDIPSNQNAISLAGWEHALERANHAAEFQPPKHLQEAVGPDDTTFVLDHADGLQADGRASPSERPLVRVDDDASDDVYELIRVIDAPVGSSLKAKASAQDTELMIEQAAVFQPGDIITIDKETMEVVSAPSVTTLAADATADATTISVVDADGLDAGETIKIASERMKIISVDGDTLKVDRGVEDTTAVDQALDSTVREQGDIIEVERGRDGTTASRHNVTAEVFEKGNEITVERGVEGTEPAEHAAGTELFQGPVLPPTGPLTGETGTPPCGQLAAAPAATPGPPVQVSGAVSMSIDDNFFDLNGQRNPNLAVKAREAVTIQLTSAGSQPHNMRTAGADGEFDSDDDAVSNPDLIPGGGSGTLAFSFSEPGTYEYRCDFHPDQMRGEIAVAQ